jgi:hypothetical protein
LYFGIIGYVHSGRVRPGKVFPVATNHASRSDAIFHPLLKSSEAVEIIESGTASTVSHAGNEDRVAVSAYVMVSLSNDTTMRDRAMTAGTYWLVSIDVFLTSRFLTAINFCSADDAVGV